MQVLGGFAETTAGVSAGIYSGGLMAGVGSVIAAHGLDQMTAGMGTIISGNQQATYSEQIMQGAGVETNTSRLINDSLSIVGTFGGTWAVNTSRAAMMESFKVPETVGTMGRGIYTSEDVLGVIKPNNRYIGSPGSRTGIRELSGGNQEAEKMFSSLVQYGKKAAPASFSKKISIYKLNDGTIINYRIESSYEGPPTVEIQVPNQANSIKLKYKE